MSKSEVEAKAEFYFERAMMQNNNGEHGKAIWSLQDAILARPSYHEAYNNRGVLLQLIGNHFDAVLCHEAAIRIYPDAGYYNNAASALLSMDQFDRADEYLHKALELKPVFAEAEVNLGNILRLKDRNADAIPHYRNAAAARPDYVDAHLNLSFALLQNGDLEEGWKEYEYRWNSKQLPERGLLVPPWEGQKNCRVFLYGEQGYGDVLQFMRYATILAEKYNCQVHLEVRSPLRRVAETLKGVSSVVVLGGVVPEVDYCLPMMSAPRMVGTNTIADIPSTVPYIHTTESDRVMWQKRLATLPPGLRVGVCWAGHNRESNPTASAIDARRSTALMALAPLAQVKGISWVSLQRGIEAAQVKTPPSGMTIYDPEDEIIDFYDTAAMIGCLDLVITVDTAVVHLAGAVGVPTWVLSRHDNCWRWFGSRKDSPWYPSVTQFRQPYMGAWEPMIAEVKECLQKFVDEHQQWAS